MDPLSFLTWQFVLFSLVVAVIMYVTRTILEYCIPKLIDTRLWNSLLLMLLPVFIGAGLGGWWKMYPYATGLTTISEHVGYGAVAGLLSTLLFKIIKELLMQKMGGMLGVNSTAPNMMNQVPTTKIEDNENK